MLRVIISCGVGGDYSRWAAEHLQNYARMAPEVPVLTWIDKFPPGSRTHHESHYGFKVHAFREAFRQGYTSVLWLDSAIELVQHPKPLFDVIERDGFFAVADYGKLLDHTRADLFDFFKVTPEEVAGRCFMGGSVLGFDTTNKKTAQVFEQWEAAEQAGLFSNGQWPQHRHDETCLAFALHKAGLQPTPFETSGHPLANGSEMLWWTRKLGGRPA